MAAPAAASGAPAARVFGSREKEAAETEGGRELERVTRQEKWRKGGMERKGTGGR